MVAAGADRWCYCRRFGSGAPGGASGAVPEDEWFWPARRGGDGGRRCALRPAARTGLTGTAGGKVRCPRMSHPDSQAESQAEFQDREAAGSRHSLRHSPAHRVVNVAASLQAGLDSLRKCQHPDGYWVGELEADSSLEADTILLDYFLGTVDQERVRKLAQSIRNEQGAEGGWSMYPGGSPNINVTVKAYFALRLAGYPEREPALEKARQVALQLGGVEATNSFTRICLCFLDQYDWKAVPALPPELLLLPNFSYINIYEVSSWSRAILVPLSIIYAFQPRRPLPAGVR